MYTDLHYHTERNFRWLALGVLLMVLLLAAILVAARPAQASTTFTVTNSSDSGAGSLRQAITDANNTPGADTINFNIPGGGVHTITPANELPAISDPVTINGYSQPGSHPNTKAVGNDAVLNVELSGASAPGYGLFVIGSNSTIKGLVVNRWAGAGIVLIGSGAAGNRVTGNFIGTDATGTQDYGNSMFGVYVNQASGNTIGGTTAGARNVISGNDRNGVYIEYANSTNNTISGNYIGTDKTGTKVLGNNLYGVYIAGANNTVGGTTTGARNVISANNISGVLLSGVGGNKVMGNYVGTNASGTKVLSNLVGVGITSPNNIIGGTTAGARNVISGNGYDGVLIAFNDSTGNRVLSNSISSNGGLGIDLSLSVDGDGPTPNDPGDADTGPNSLQNFPVLSSARTGSTKTTVKGKLNSTPAKTFTIQFFSNPRGNEGKKLIGQKSVTTDGNGDATFTFSPNNKVAAGQIITATATGEEGTSEFSAPKKVLAK